MRKTDDAFGELLVDQLEGRQAFEIVERDDGFVATSGGAPRYFAPYRAWPRPERTAMRFVRGRVLDVGCGGGRCALYLQGRGHEVIGIDISPLAVRVSKRQGLREGRVMSVTQVNCSLGSFDTVLMMGNNFGLFTDPRRARWLLKRLHGVTTAGARIVAGSRDPYVGAGPEHREYHALNRRRGRMPGQVRIRVRYRQYVGQWFDYLMVSKDEMRSILDGSGWQVRKFIESGGPDYVAIIEKCGVPAE